MMTRERELLQQAPEPEPVAYLVEGWHDGKLIAHIPRLTLEDAKASAAVFSQHYTTTKLVPLYAAPPAAPAPTAPVPDGWVMVPRGLLRRLIAEALTFDPSLQDKEAIEQAKQLAASPAAPVPDGWVMVPRKELGDGISLLHQAMVGACDCLTKTHEAKYHAESCFYRRLSEQCDKLEAAIAASPATPVVREPFSKAQLHRLYVNSPELHKDAASGAAFTRIVQLAEAAHGITGGSK